MMKEKRGWIYDGLLVAVLLVAAFLRITGADWGELQHQHPDELFLTSVVSNLRMQVCEESFTSIDQCPPENQRLMGIGDYFNTATSSLNPHNRGFAFFVYGTLPMFIIRGTAEITGQTDYSALKLLGRQFSALADLGTLLLLYFIVVRLYNRRTALLATAFSGLAVMQIQQSHFFTTDLFVNLFSFLAIYFAVQILLWEPADQGSNSQTAQEGDANSSPNTRKMLAFVSYFIHDPIFWFSFGFGVAFGMALASKLNIYPLAFLLPLVFGLRALTVDRIHWSKPDSELSEDVRGSIGLQVKERFPGYSNSWMRILVFLVVGGLMALICFRVFQPYAFDGFTLNPQWIANIAEQRGQARGDADLPWNLQWARRTHLYSFENLTVWGLGLPLGVLAWAGFLTMGWRIFKGERRHVLLWSWTAFYFLWQSFQFNPTMRYQLPIYPLLAMMAAWFIFEFANVKWKNFKFAGIAYGLGLAVLLVTAIWAMAFLSIYTRDEPRIAASRWIYQNIPGPVNLRVRAENGSIQSQPLAFPAGRIIRAEEPYETSFTSVYTGQLTEVLLGYVGDPTSLPESESSPRRLNLQISGKNPDGEEVTASASVVRDFTAGKDPRGEPALLELDLPFEVAEGTSYFLRIETDAGQLSLTGSSLANETDYDFPLPFRTEYDGFGGIYRGDLNFQVYWEDNLDKLTRFIETLEQTDYILIPTNHQYAQITRIPERYPLTTVYYRELLGCPQQMNIIACYRTAEPGMFQGTLGFDLVAVFESYPRLGPLVINDQAAEEAFTFYDHPKVLIFKKSDGYNSARVIGTLGAVDLTSVVHLTPKEVAGYKDLMLPTDRLAEQRAGGTWSQLFDYEWLQNRYPFLGLVWWYGFIFVLGLFTYPIARLVMPGLGDMSYALARTFGFVLLSYISWSFGSLGVSYSRTTIGLVFALIAVVGSVLGWVRRDELARAWKSKRRDFLMLEALFLAFFLFDLFIRLGNPDLWHPSKGGERPMDFSYFNAVLKSTSFPPYDPWFAGGYINYYYYGFVLVATPVKLLGIVPTIAYNLILPTLFGMVAVSAFAIGWKILDVEHDPAQYPEHPNKIPGFDIRFIGGLAAALMTVVLGNLGTVQMVFRALARLAAPGGDLVNSIFFQRLVWAGEGLFKTLFKGVVLPIGRGEWYWNPSRVIPPGPGNEITEFPYFTFLYSDLHAHMIVIPLGLFVIAWALATVKSRGTSLISLVGGALVIGALYPTNLSDIYTYLPVGLTALGYVLWRTTPTAWPRWVTNVPPIVKRAVVTILGVVVLTALSLWLYEPYRAAYSQAYSKLDMWTASQTPISSYLTHWGLFLFIIFFWLIWETRQWMAATPASALSKLKPFTLWIELALAGFFVVMLFLAYRQIWVGWIALPLAVWAGLLMLQPALPEEKRLTLFWTGTALLITLIVELVSVRGDIGRMNTIFKFYLQAWVLLSVSAGAAFAWVLSDLRAWLPRWRNLWQGGMIVLAACAFLFTVTATADKVTDRINNDAPHTLDAMEYMAHAEYWDAQTMNLSQDYYAIRWMQDNIQGSPVIVEANCPEYRWCSRFTIYTGLPGVVGWNWHQRQQRALLSPTLVTDRVDAIGNFYNSADLEYVRSFLDKYDVRYIVVGQLEQIYYPEEGLSKFAEYNGIHWKDVYHDEQTTIYEVLP